MQKQKYIHCHLVEANDPHHSCKGCALHQTIGCLEDCEDFVVDGCHFKEVENV